MRSIIFVDDELKVLEGLQRMLRSARHDWNMAFVTSGAEALELMAQRRFDVVVSDMRMPGMDGAELLAEVMRLHPQCVRIILSGHSERESIMRSVGPAHQYLMKPSDPEELKLTIKRACALRDILTDEKLRLLVTRMSRLPSLPSIYTAIVRELKSPDASIRKAGMLISNDPGMTAKILQMVNSAFFGLRRHITNPTEAVSLLGLDTVIALVLSIEIFASFDNCRLPGFSHMGMWAHSVKVASFARWIAKAERQPSNIIEASFTGGLLHDVGKLVLAANEPERYGEVIRLWRTGEMTPLAAERTVFETTHAEVGAFLLGLWGLPYPIVESIAFHHSPSDCASTMFAPLTAVHVANSIESEANSFKPLTAVHIANAIQEKESGGDHPGMSMSIDPAYLSDLGLLDRLGTWKELCSQAA